MIPKGDLIINLIIVYANTKWLLFSYQLGSWPSSHLSYHFLPYISLGINKIKKMFDTQKNKTKCYLS